MSDFQEVTGETFEALVLGSPIPVLVDFAAEWCGPCKAAMPLLRDVQREYDGEAMIVKVDIDKSPDLRERFGIRGVPTFMLFRDGELLEQRSGASSRSDFCAMIDRGLGASA
jgi:thioredoxin 1